MLIPPSRHFCLLPTHPDAHTLASSYEEFIPLWSGIQQWPGLPHQLRNLDFSNSLPCAQLHSPFILSLLSRSTPNLGRGEK